MTGVATSTSCRMIDSAFRGERTGTSGPEGLTWDDGQGETPAWLQRAVNAGQSVKFLRVE